MSNIENYKSALESVSKKEMEQRKVIKKLLQDKEELKKQLDLYSFSERSNSIDFAKYLEALTPVNRISVHPSPRTLSVAEIYDKYKRHQERNVC